MIRHVLSAAVLFSAGLVSIPSGAQENIETSQFGYWRFQPVKAAYLSVMPGEKPPEHFTVRNMKKEVVYTGTPELVPNPKELQGPIQRLHPGERLYLLDFSAVTGTGCYYVQAPGYYPSKLFMIAGKIPKELLPLPTAADFRKETGLVPSETELPGTKVRQDEKRGEAAFEMLFLKK